MTLKFGTSGLRGLVTDMTSSQVARYTRAFLAACDLGEGLYVGYDLRASSPRIAEDVIAAARQSGVRVTACGAVPTPALALAARQARAAAVMVTGSHIPADRNGLKFYSRSGEITKEDETAIQAMLAEDAQQNTGQNVLLETDKDVNARYAERYISAFGTGALTGRRIGLYAHSAVGRDVLGEILAALGAEVVDLGRSAEFIPVDTEAVAADTRAQIAEWVRAHRLDALVSTDGDSDRPLLADETGAIVPGDILGQITAQMLGAEVVVTPISSNSGVLQNGFDAVRLTRIGSPFVIAGMEAAGDARVVGYEANGGFLLGFDAQGPAGPLAALPTRDCTLPLLAVLWAAGTGSVSARVAQEPPVCTRADRLQDIPTEQSAAWLAELRETAAARAEFLAAFGQEEAGLDLTDGLRMTLSGGGVVHLRPSGNAPEMRVYVEAASASVADRLIAAALAQVRQAL